MNGLPRDLGRSVPVRQLARGRQKRLWALGLALGAASAVQGADLGGLRVLSASGEPLRAEIAVTSLTPHEASTLKATVAPRDIYSQTRLEYSEALSSLKLDIEDRPGGRKVVVISSPSPLDVHVLDLLVELTWNKGRFIRQYTFILDAPPPLARAPETQPGAGAAATVKPGDTLYGIAGRLRPQGASMLQTMVALLQANPQAFVEGNMNRLRAGASLAMPGAEAVTAIDPVEAAALFAAQSEAFEAYRQRVAGAASGVPASGGQGGPASQGNIGAGAANPDAGRGEGDSLRLSGGGSESAGVDQTGRDRLEEERDATAKAVREAESRMQELQSNVEAMRGLLEAQNETLARMEQQARGATSEGAPTPAGPAMGEPAATEPAATAGETAADQQPPPAQADSIVGRLRDSSVAVLGGIVAILAAILGALALRRRAAQAEAQRAREAAQREADEAQEEADALPPSGQEPGRVNHLRDWDDIPPFPIPDTPVQTAGEPEDYPDDDELDPPRTDGRLVPPMPAAAAAAFGLDLNLDGAAQAPSDVSAKLDLAKAYVDMGDRDGARELLEEVVREGDAGQREKARALLASW